MSHGGQKSIYCLTAVIITIFIIVQIRQRYRARQEMLEHIHAEQLNEAKLQFFIKHFSRDTHPDVSHNKPIAKANGYGLRYRAPAELQYHLP